MGFNPFKLVLRVVFKGPVLLHAVAAIGLKASGSHGAALSVVMCRVAGWVHSKSQQQVPFTKRRHAVLLPCWAEAVMGSISHESYLAEQKGKQALLPATDRDAVLVQRVANRLIAAACQGCPGGGYQKHLELCEWQVSVIENGAAGAFVLPGGKIIVHTGLLRLIKYDEDMLAMVLGHEMAHVFARHGAESVGLRVLFGIGVIAVVSVCQHAERRRKEEERQELRRQGRPVPPQIEDPALPDWVTELLLPGVYNLFVQLPHSRRNEFEADLIGLKLMALARFNPEKAPRVFELFASLHPGQQPAVARLLSTHPDSMQRANVLRAEVAWMQANKKLALDQVGTCPAQDHWVI